MSKYDMDSSPINSRRRRSPLATLDPDALRELCELHPWDLGRLSAASGFDRSVLSHVFAGRRSLPQNTASKFLSLIGLLPSGKPDRNHLFVLQARLGNVPILKAWLERLLPNGADVVQLHRSTQDGSVSGDPTGGWAMFDGETAVLVYGAAGTQLPVNGGSWPVIGDVDHADQYLNPEKQPNRSQVVKLVSDTPTLERYVLDHPDWDLVKRAAAKKGLTPMHVLDLIADYQFPTGDLKTLFPRAHLEMMRRRGR